ncbi:hypothetical protein LCGC14_1448560 [marine sediment metagenome]|uniref:Uncharacterized protein n=1 Tax=marine sediment metagenome TaxID=412755 RepID=A0A0F9LZ14_9ZZZZ
MTFIKNLTYFTKWFLKSDNKESIALAFMMAIADLFIFFGAWLGSLLIVFIALGVNFFVYAALMLLYLVKKNEVTELKKKKVK